MLLCNQRSVLARSRTASLKFWSIIGRWYLVAEGLFGSIRGACCASPICFPSWARGSELAETEAEAEVEAVMRVDLRRSAAGLPMLLTLRSSRPGIELPEDGGGPSVSTFRFRDMPPRERV